MSENHAGVRVFLSHASADTERISELVNALRARGALPWTDADIRPGDMWEEALERAMEHSDVYVPVITSGTVTSPWAQFELGAMLAISAKRNRRLIPVFVGDDRPRQVPFGLGRYHGIVWPAGGTEAVADAIVRASVPQAA